MHQSINSNSLNAREMGRKVGEYYVAAVQQFRYLSYNKEKGMFVKIAPLRDTRESDPALFLRERERLNNEKKVAATIIKFLAYIQADDESARDDVINDSFERKHAMVEEMIKIHQGMPNLGGFSLKDGEHAAGMRLQQHYWKYRTVFQNAAAVIDKKLKIS